MDIIASGQTFAEALAGALNEIVEQIDCQPGEATVAIPLRAREADLPSVAQAMCNELLAEIEEGSRVVSVRIDGLMKRDGDYICWGYAQAVDDQRTGSGPADVAHDIQVIEMPGRWEVRCRLDQVQK